MYPIYLVLFLCIGTLYCYEICFVRLTLQYKTGKLHMHSLMHKQNM